MASQLIDRRDLNFLLFDVLDAAGLCHLERFKDHNAETFDATIQTARAIAEEWFAPCAAKLDANEPQFRDGKVDIIPEVAAALEHYYEAGFGAATHDYELGGMQLPFTISVACKAIFGAANMPILSYASLSSANSNVILNFGSNEQKEKYLEPLLQGRYMGTMALTEPQAGSSLSDIKTTATPASDGSYRLSGNKIFISGGDHELADNIVHLVLARIKGAPAGVKGLSLFIVPKYLVKSDGALGERNDVSLAGLIHKLGWRGTTSTMLNFGERGGATGYLIGEPNHGLVYMFQMMNEARIGVGVGAVSLGYASYLQALEYARQRPQGRSPQEKDPAVPQQAIVHHADVRRMLLASKCYVEGALCLSLYGATLVDQKARCPDQAIALKASRLLEILTPILKSWPSKYCLKANDLAIQIHGGYGYTREYAVERLYRDNRLNPIHEGTEGIQGLDLLGRKVSAENGAYYQALIEEIEETIKDCQGQPQLAPFALSLQQRLGLVNETTELLIGEIKAGRVNLALANATSYLHALGHIVVAWLWLRQVNVCSQLSGDEKNPEQRSFIQGKLTACRYFFNYELPNIDVVCHLLQTMDDTCLAIDPDCL